MKQIANLIALFGMVAAAGCTANQAGGQFQAGNSDAAIFQKGGSAIAGTNVGLVGTKTIALTFDDGPKRGLTDQLLDYLQTEDVKATFFMVGKYIDGNDDLVERMSNEGHSLGNHTFDHSPIVKMSQTNMAHVYAEIALNDKLISPHLRSGKHVFFRSPGGSWTSLIADAMNNQPDIAQKYIGPVNWDVGGSTFFTGDDGRVLGGEPVKFNADSGLVTFAVRSTTPPHKIISTFQRHAKGLAAAADWQCDPVSLNIPTAMCLEGYMNEIQRHQGGIVLLHDIHPRTIEMVKLLVPRLKELGYSFITLDEIPNIQKFE